MTRMLSYRYSQNLALELATILYILGQKITLDLFFKNLQIVWQTISQAIIKCLFIHSHIYSCHLFIFLPQCQVLGYSSQQRNEDPHKFNMKVWPTIYCYRSSYLRHSYSLCYVEKQLYDWGLWRSEEVILCSKLFGKT